MCLEGMFFNTIYSSPIWSELESNQKFFRTAVVGTICYILMWSLFQSKVTESYQVVQKYKKYIYYVFAGDVSLFYLMTKFAGDETPTVENLPKPEVADENVTRRQQEMLKAKRLEMIKNQEKAMKMNQIYKLRQMNFNARPRENVLSFNEFCNLTHGRHPDYRKLMSLDLNPKKEVAQPQKLETIPEENENKENTISQHNEKEEDNNTVVFPVYESKKEVNIPIYKSNK